MIRSVRIMAGATAVAALAAFALPASAQYANEYTPAKLIRQGSTSKAIAGSGTVVVQVQVNANGSHKVIKIIHSSNSADNAAALDIASHSTYRPAHRGKSAITSFYDFTLRFKGRSVASSGEETVATGSTAARIDALIHQGKYEAAKAQLQQGLASDPNNPTLNEELGTVNYFLNDYAGAAAAFDKVPKVSKTFSQVAAQSYALAAVKGGASPQQAVAYGKRAVSMLPSPSAYYALGSAELQAGDATSAVGDLKKALDMAQADSRSDAKTRANIAAQLYQAYTKAGDTANAQKTLALIKQLDPSNSSVGMLQANSYLQAGIDADKAGNHAEALKDFQQAAAVGPPQAQVTAYGQAALEQNTILQSQKTPATKDDYAKVKAYADKALAINPNDALANFAEGIGLAGEWVLGGKSDSSLKAQALAALNKAKASAQSSGNFALSLNIDNFIKTTLQ